MTGMTGTPMCEKANNFLGNGTLLKSKLRQTLLTTSAYKTEQFTLNLRQKYVSLKIDTAYLMPGA